MNIMFPRPLWLLFCLWLAACGGSKTADVQAPPDADAITPVSTDPWVRVVGDGFGTPSLNTAPEFEVYNGYLYLAIAPKDQGLAKLYRSQTGDPGSWTELTLPLDGDKSIHAFGKTSLGGGYLWCGSGGASGGMIFRTQNGISWIPIAHRGFGNPQLKAATPHMVVFKDPADGKSYLYAAMNSHGAGNAAIVKRIPFDDSDPDHWTTVHDFTGSQPTVDLVSYFTVWKNTLYFGTNAGAQLWQSSDGVTFTQNTSVGSGFGDSSNMVIASLEVFGDYLYATTTNAKKGGQIWRSNDGSTWEPITADAFGKGPAVSELRSIRAAFGKLWVTGYTETTLSAGTPIWRSDDGKTWVQSNVDGFGDPNNNGQNAVVIGFGDYEYFAGPNYVDGAQLWRARMQ